MDTFNSESLHSEEFRCGKILVKRKCKYCDFVTDLRITLDDHVWRHHKTSHDNKTDLQIRTYPCTNCDFESYSLLVWRSHQNRCNYICKENNKFSEALCRFVESGIPEEHNAAERKLHASEYPDNNAVSLKAYAELNRASHKKFFSCYTEEDRHTTRVDPKNIKWFKCDRCGYKAKRIFVLRRHIVAHHTVLEEIKWFECYQCGYKAKRKQHLKSHIVARHKAPEEIKWFECHQCGFKAKQKFVLKRHIVERHTVSERIKWFECHQCEYKAKQKQALETHIVARHTVPEEIEWFKCHQCGYKAKRISHLKTHIVAHHTVPEEIKWFDCDRCEFKAKYKSSLKQHITRKHTRDKLVELKCSQCFFNTVYKSSLKTHMSTEHRGHGGFKWFRCDQCRYKSKQRNVLEKHIAVTHHKASKE